MFIVELLLFLVAVLYLALCVRNLFIFPPEENKIRIIPKKRAEGETATYIIPGFLPPPAEAFKPWGEKLPGSVYFCDLSPIHYFSEREIVDQIWRHAVTHKYKYVEFVSISLGTKIALALCPNVAYASKLVMICPATRGRMLKKRVRIPLMILLPIVAAVVFLLPFINHMKLIKVDGVEHSLVELLTEAFSLVYDMRPCEFGSVTDGKLILAEKDEFISNRNVLKTMQRILLTEDRPAVLPGAKHARVTENNGVAYMEALEQVQAFKEFPIMYVAPTWSMRDETSNAEVRA